MESASLTAFRWWNTCAERGCCRLEVLSLKRFRDYDPEQPYLLPPAPVDWLPDGHLAFFIHELMDHLDLSRIYVSPCSTSASALVGFCRNVATGITFMSTF